MSAVRPRRLAFVGRVLADAFWLDVGLIGEAEARRRVLRLWRPGARLRRVGTGWLLWLPETTPVSPPLPGRPLVREGGALVAVPLEAREREALPATDGVWLPVAGVLHPVPIGPVVDVGAWLTVGLRPVEGLRLGPVETDARAALEPIRETEPTPPGGRRQRLAEALSRAPTASVPVPLEARLPWWARWLAWLVGAVDAALERLEPAPPRRPRTPGVPPPPPPRTWIGAVRERLSGWLVGLAALGPLSWLARSEAAWLRELMRAFERGDLDAVLARAVPLGGLPSPGEAPTTSPGRTLPLGGATRLLLAGTDVRATLRALYEAAAERLVDEGRPLEAAYVLADLLDAPQRAVDVLIQADETSRAAALSEGRELDQVQSALLWVQADALDRAVLLCRRHGVWEAVVARVADEAPWAREALVERQARTRWEAGDVGEALARVSGEAGLGTLRGGWLQALLEDADSRSAAAVHGLARAWRGDRLMERVEALLVAEDAGAAWRRLLFGEALMGAGVEPRDALDRRLLARLARAVHADATQDPASERLVDRLLAQLGDAPLVRDLSREPVLGRAPARRQWAGTDRGALAVHDLAGLPDGRLLVALGSAGVRLIDPDGRLLTRLPVPADHLVVDEVGGRALLVEASRRIHTLDLRTARTRPWAEVPLDAWAPSFDGERWPVVVRGMLYVIDALDPGWRHLWKVRAPGLGAVTASPGDLRALVGEAIWRWELPAMRLRAKVPTRADEVRWFGDEAVVVAGSRVVAVGLSPRLILGDLHGEVLGGLAEAGRALVACRVQEGVVVHHEAHGERHALHLRGATTACLRRWGVRWLVGDDLGRVIAADAEGGVPVDLRIAPA